MPESDQYISSIVADEEVFRLKAKRDWDNCINTAEEKGRNEGREEGRAEEKLDIARKMKSKGFTASEISEMTGLSEDEINAL